MTPEEQAQVNAAHSYMERTLANMAREGAMLSAQIEALSAKVKELTEENEKLKAKPPLEAVK